jgi:putative ATPase
VLVGATTENPSFELNKALLSRARVYVFKNLSEAELHQIIHRALNDKEKGLGELALNIPENLQKKIIEFAQGDARNVLNILEIVSQVMEQGSELMEEILGDVLSTGKRYRFDKKGEDFYDDISALHKSIRGSDPDASLYWLVKMLEGGCDPLYLARRLVRVASEDIGNADPRALTLTLEAWDVLERLGSPEGELTLAQTVIYLAVAPKSNAVYVAYNAAKQDLASDKSLGEVPVYLRNAPTKLMKDLDYGKAYRYPHDEPDAYAIGVHYFPLDKKAIEYYRPTDRGLEIKIKEKLDKLKALNKK